MSKALETAENFATFLSRAIPAIIRWWKDRKDHDLADQLAQLDAHLARDFDSARVAIAEKYAARTASATPVSALSPAGLSMTRPGGPGLPVAAPRANALAAILASAGGGVVASPFASTEPQDSEDATQPDEAIEDTNP